MLIYVKEGISAAELQLTGADQVTECCGITVPWGKGGGEVIKLLLVYRPPEVPGSPGDQGNTGRLCDLLRRQSGRVVVCGDFNLPETDWERGWSPVGGEMMVIDLLGDMFWSQLVRGSTHRAGNTLDLCISSPEQVAGVEVIQPLGTSDHSGLEVNIIGNTADGSTKEEVPDWGKADMLAMKTKLSEVGWEDELRDLGGGEAMDRFYEIVDRVTGECVPNKRRRAANRPLWMTGNIMRRIRKKRRLWRAYTGEKYYMADHRDFVAYQEVQREIKRQIRRAKRKLERSLAKKGKKNSKRFHAYMKSKTSNKVSVGPLMGEE